MDSKKLERTVYTLEAFMQMDVAQWGTLLKEHHLDCMQEDASVSQRRAWFNCFKALRQQFGAMVLDENLSRHVYLIFEYELPRERGRRPDVLLLAGNHVLVLEFKGHSIEDKGHIDQAKHYARDIRNYHEQSHSLKVVPFLVLVSAENRIEKMDEVSIISADNLAKAVHPYLTAPFDNVKAWFHSEYAPLPTLLQSAQMLFKENDFPQIKKAHSAGIPQTLAKLHDIAQQAALEGTHHLALITGVPGAGKTLVGLQFVFETFKSQDKQKAVFLSGNGPLVDVLQFSLGNRNFVQSVHGFLKQYATGSQLPSEDVMIYDEAQRAWDEEKVAASRRESKNAEPTDFINIGGRKQHCLLIGLIGEGQEIYIGEESGMTLWVDALNSSDVPWTIHCPEKLSQLLASYDPIIDESLNLTTSLRTHQAMTLQAWVENLLDNKIERAAQLANQLMQEDYPIYITRDLDQAKKYLHERYKEEPEKTYGIIASSKSKILPRFGVKNDFASTKSFRVEHYYVDTKHPAYCRNLNAVVTEFGCQGLELDMPLLGWDTDWIYQSDGWHNNSTMSKAKDAYKLRKNSYRVLLTRGRDGLVIYVPDTGELDSTFKVLQESCCTFF